MRDIRVQQEAFDPGAELARLEALGGGAVASFTGLVRADGGLVEMTLEHYPAMTARAMERIAVEAEARWPLIGLTLIHRHGPLQPGDRIVFVGTASSHRAAALESCAFLIDWLKTAAPFWKRESFADGRQTWVEPRKADDVAASRWQQNRETA
ncbi:molybdenum cofactor biosynthesis protein MoaE [Sphingomonas sp. DBB INV C78]|uniref:molybdenum cofactor biosynthesis protein MoaE n=1 Tax=Sphingomonas sp. DBB INV C78 TaxID=3349434 RepID=UPI0036D39369